MILEDNLITKKASLIKGAFFLLLCGLVACEIPEPKQAIRGYAQGTTYNISYYGNQASNPLKKGIDSLLLRMDYALSNYRTNSQIVQLNGSQEAEYRLIDSCGFWRRVLKVSEEVYRASEGAFDPTVYPLVKAYGFGPGQQPSIASDSLREAMLALVGFKAWSWQLSGDSLVISKPQGAELDFNAVAQGLAVDYIAEYLDNSGVESYFVELGGEVRVGAAKPSGEPWRLGLEKPLNQVKRELADTLKITNISVATSGSNRKFYELEGKRYSHAINPITGKPVSHQVLSATIQHPSCAYADAWATAALVLGEDATALLAEQGMEVILQGSE